MIPFNHLGWIFKTFGTIIYPTEVRNELCIFLKSLPKKSRILDIGSGTGTMSQFAYNCRDDLILIAVDPSKGMLKFSPEYISTYNATAENLPFESESFNLLLMGESLHHFRNVDQAIEEAIRVLNNKGKLFIYDFNIDTFIGKNICRSEKLLGEPGNFFEPNALKAKLEKYGFAVKIKKYGWRYTISAVLEKVPSY